MMKRNACYSILIALLSTLTLTACIESSGLDDPESPSPDKSLGKASYTGCEKGRDVVFEDRCIKPDALKSFSMASRVDGIKIPQEDNPMYDVINSIDTYAKSKTGDDKMTVENKIKEQIDDGKFNLVVEFLGWDKDSERPKDRFPIMLWPGTTPTTSGEVTQTKIYQKEDGIPSVLKDTAFSRSTFVNAKYSKVDGEDQYEVAANTVRTISFPIFLYRVKTLVKVEGATLTATVEKDGDGIKIVKGKIEGDVTKNSMLEGIYKLQQDCSTKHGVTCLELDGAGHQCKEAGSDLDAGCGGDSVCKLAAQLCGTESTLVDGFFGGKNADTKKAVIDITGKPIQIDGWEK